MKALLSSSPISSLSKCHRFVYLLLLHFSSSSSSANDVRSSISIDFLIQTLGFSKSQADSFSKRFGSRKAHQKPDCVIHLLSEFGFSETQIRKTVLVRPHILFSDVDKNLKPKLSLFQNEAGLTGSNLGLFISKNPYILDANLERRLIPNIRLLKKIIPEIENEENRERRQIVPQKCYRFFTDDPEKLLSNVSFLQSCGIVGDKLSSLLKRNSSLFIRRESSLKDLVCKAQEMGFLCNSRMFVHALSALHRISSETLERKFKLLRSFGFSQEECSTIFRGAPLLLHTSEEKIKLGIEFFDSAGLEQNVLVHYPFCLMFSLEKRVIPRFRVYQILKSKQQQQLLNKKCPSFPYFLSMTEKGFLEKFVFQFGDYAEELMAAYNSGTALKSLTEQN